MRLEKPKVYSIFLGSKIPPSKELGSFKRRLAHKVYADLLGAAVCIYLTKEQLIEAEKIRRRHESKFARLSNSQKDEKDEIDTVNFVYTTLSTEGVPVTRQDAGLAYNFSQRNIRSIRDENLGVALDMVLGLRKVKESEKGLSLEFICGVHKTIMEQYKDKSPGRFRTKPAYIYLKSYDKVEEIGFRPPPPQDLKKELSAFVKWYNDSIGTVNAIELAALTHLHFYKIHPFADGNKRVARLLLNKALQDSGYPMLNISENTSEYFDALVKSVEKEEEKPFVLFVFGEFVKSL